jgi:hypothetical protein
MKVPTEADLIEVENFMSRWEPQDGPVKIADNAFLTHHRVWETLKTLIALARDPSKLLQNIAIDDALDRAMQPPREFTPEDLAEVRRAFPPPESPRRPAPKLSMVVQPTKTKTKITRQRITKR